MSGEVGKRFLSTGSLIADPLESVRGSLPLNPGVDAVCTCFVCFFQFHSCSLKLCDCRERVIVIKGNDRMPYDMHKLGQYKSDYLKRAILCFWSKKKKKKAIR